MRYFRCPCGKQEAWSSMGVPSCTGCSTCNVTLAENPLDHRPIGPHDFGDPEWEVDKKTGETWQVNFCNRCMKKVRIE